MYDPLYEGSLLQQGACGVLANPLDFSVCLRSCANPKDCMHLRLHSRPRVSNNRKICARSWVRFRGQDVKIDLADFWCFAKNRLSRFSIKFPRAKIDLVNFRNFEDFESSSFNIKFSRTCAAPQHAIVASPPRVVGPFRLGLLPFCFLFLLFILVPKSTLSLGYNLTFARW